MGEYQQFFLHNVYENATGVTYAGKREIIALVATENGAKWIERNCANPFWFWTAVGAACQCASTLPLTVSDLEDGARALFEERSEALGRTSGITGWPVGYSGPETPWHIFDSFCRGHIWNNRRGIEVGMTYGLLMMQRQSTKGFSLLNLFIQALPPKRAGIIYNPLFAELSATKPVTV